MNRCIYFILSEILFSCIFSFNCFAESCDSVNIRYEVLKETNTLNSIEKVKISKNFKATQDLNFSYTQDAYWIKFPVDTRCSNYKNFVLLNFRCLDYVNFYLVRDGVLSDSLITGYLRNVASRQKAISHFVYQLPLEPQKKDVLFVRVQKKEGTLQAHFSIKDEITLLNSTNKERQIIFFFLGVCFIMVVFTLSYYLYFKKKMYLWYMLYIISFAMHQISNFGYGTLYIWKDWHWFSNVSRVLWNVTAIISILMLARELLKVKTYSSKYIYDAYKYLIIIMLFILPVPFLPLPEYPWRFLIYNIFSICLVICILLFIVSAINAIRRNHTPGYFFLAGEVILLITFSLFLMKNYDLLPMSFVAVFLTDYTILYLGIVMMSLGLFSLLNYTRAMHYQVIREYEVIREFVEKPKADPKILTDEEKEKLRVVYKKIEEYFKKEKPYLSDELNLNELSNSMQIQEHLISKAINLCAEMHFFDYVNSFRINEAKELLSDVNLTKTYTIEALSTQCGFSNKTSFNKAFKKFTGETPSSFREKTQ